MFLFQSMFPEVCNFGISILLFIHSISIGFGVHDVLAYCWQASQLLDQKVGKIPIAIGTRLQRKKQPLA